jgi:hypothetical protein
MSYRITIERTNGRAPDATMAQKLYEQTVEELDMCAVMTAVNKRPRKSRAKPKAGEAVTRTTKAKPKAGAGAPA